MTFVLWWSILAPFVVVYVLYAERTWRDTNRILFGTDDLDTLHKSQTMKAHIEKLRLEKEKIYILTFIAILENMIQIVIYFLDRLSSGER